MAVYSAAPYSLAVTLVKPDLLLLICGEYGLDLMMSMQKTRRVALILTIWLDDLHVSN